MMTIFRKAAFAALLGVAGTATAWAAPHSSFQNSCRNIELQTNADGVWIAAECKTRDGRYRSSNLELRGIVNDDGRLRSRNEATSFQRSCRDIELAWDADEVEIRAVCRTASGGERRTGITLMNIENNDGRLMRGRR